MSKGLLITLGKDFKELKALVEYLDKKGMPGDTPVHMGLDMFTLEVQLMLFVDDAVDLEEMMREHEMRSRFGRN